MVNDMSPWWDRLITDSENSFDHVKRAMDVELGKLASEVKGT